MVLVFPTIALWYFSLTSLLMFREMVLGMILTGAERLLKELLEEAILDGLQYFSKFVVALSGFFLLKFSVH